jgi:preprotein translocase subunit SecD
MKVVRALGRILVPASLALLAACHTTPTQQQAQTSTTTATPEAQPQQPAESNAQAAHQGAPVAVFLADTSSHEGWTAVNIPSGAIYVNPQPVVTRDDLSGVQAGTSKQGDGLLALELNKEGAKKVADITTQNPNKRLALVVGRTMMAAPGYSAPVTTGRLVFAVGTEENATAAARAIAGVEDEGAAGASAPNAQGGATGAGAPNAAGSSSSGNPAPR